jgi:hypothetical protein
MSVDMQVTNYEITVMSRILVSKQKFAGADTATLCKKCRTKTGIGTT